MYSSCPCCGEMDNWHFQSGVINGEPIEPGEWACERCGFEYREHVKHPMSDAALKFAPVAVENVLNETIEEMAKIADELGSGWDNDKIREWAADKGRLTPYEEVAFFHADQIAIAIRARKEE